MVTTRRTPGGLWSRHADGRKGRGRHFPRACGSALLIMGAGGGGGVFPQGQLRCQEQSLPPIMKKSFPAERAGRFPLSLVSLITASHTQAGLHSTCQLSSITSPNSNRTLTIQACCLCLNPDGCTVLAPAHQLVYSSGPAGFD